MAKWPQHILPLEEPPVPSLTPYPATSITTSGSGNGSAYEVQQQAWWNPSTVGAETAGPLRLAHHQV